MGERLHKIVAEARIADGQLEAGTAEAVGIEHENRHSNRRGLDLVAGAPLNAPVAGCAGPGERVERELALVDDIGWRRSGEDGVAPWRLRIGGDREAPIARYAARRDIRAASSRASAGGDRNSTPMSTTVRGHPRGACLRR